MLRSKKMADDNGPPALVKVSDIFGISKPTIRLIEAIEHGVGKLLQPWQMKRISNAEISNFELWKFALEKSGQSIKGAELTLEDRAIIRLATHEIRRQSNREAIALEAGKEFNEELAGAGVVDEAAEPFEMEWVDRFWRLAQDVTNADLQKVWARVLVRHTTGITKFSARCLEALSLISHEEAHLLENLASVACSFDDHRNGGVILDVNHANGIFMNPGSGEIIRAAAGTLQQELLGSIGILIESGWAYNFQLSFQNGIGRFQIAGQPYNLTLGQRLNCLSDIGTGVEISPLGSEIVSLISTKPKEEYVAALKSAFQSYGMILDRA
jgi:hypothetical protein